MRRHPSSERRRRQSGNTFVELALVFTPLLALILGIVDFAIPIFLIATFHHAVREGVRYGITYQTATGLSQTDSIKRVVQQNAVGFLSGQAGLDKIQVKYYDPATFAQVTGSNANAGGNIVEVSVTGFSWSFLAPLWAYLGGNGGAGPGAVNITAISSDRLEQLPSGTTRPSP